MHREDLPLFLRLYFILIIFFYNLLVHQFIILILLVFIISESFILAGLHTGERIMQRQVPILQRLLWK